MTSPRSPHSARHAEIGGAGFAGLSAAIALAQRGWSVRVHEKAPNLRPEGFAIAIQPNGFRVFRALGIHDAAIEGTLPVVSRETRDARGRTTSLQSLGGDVRMIAREQIVRVMADKARTLGAEILTNSAIVDASPDGCLIGADGRRFEADLALVADGSQSMIAQRLGLVARKIALRDGAMRTVIAMTEAEQASAGDVKGARIIENWAGEKRVLYNMFSTERVYVVLTALNDDVDATSVPVRTAAWVRAFPHLAEVFERMAREADWARVRWDPFTLLRLKRWSSGRLGFLGDAAHAMPPNLGQGGGCAMMNALGLAVALESSPSSEVGLEQWEARERPLTDHTQRWSYRYSATTFWPERLRSAAFGLTLGVPWLRERYLRTARHVPTGTEADPLLPTGETR